MLFVGFTSAYMVRRASGGWRRLAPPALLWLNTAVLLASSAAAGGGAAPPARWDLAGARLALAVTGALGVLFVAGQLAAWRSLAARGVFLASNPHSSFFYLLTGLHVVHLLGGLAWFAVAFARLRRLALHPRRGRPGAVRHLLALPGRPLGVPVPVAVRLLSHHIGELTMHDGSDAAAMEAHWGGGAAPFGASWQKTMMWIFIVTDALLFSGLLCGYGFLRQASVVALAASSPRSSASPSSRS